jgi:hypothetical protein
MLSAAKHGMLMMVGHGMLCYDTFEGWSGDGIAMWMAAEM